MRLIELMRSGALDSNRTVCDPGAKGVWPFVGRGQTGTRLGFLLLIAFFAPWCLHGQPPLETSTPPSLRTLLDPAFGGSFWGDQLAEVATYQASCDVNGEARSYQVRLITVAEDFNKEFFAKADWPHGEKPILPVMRQSLRADMPVVGDGQTASVMTSAIVDRADPGNSIKVVISLQDWHGATFKEFRLWEDRPREIYHSFRDGEGSGERILGSDIDDYFEEELPLVLRALPFRDGLIASFWLYPNQIANRAPEPRPVASKLEVTEGNKGWRVVVETRDERRIEFEFDREYPHVLLALEHSDGRTLSLTSAERSAYWVSGN